MIRSTRLFALAPLALASLALVLAAPLGAQVKSGDAEKPKPIGPPVKQDKPVEIDTTKLLERSLAAARKEREFLQEVVRLGGLLTRFKDNRKVALEIGLKYSRDQKELSTALFPYEYHIDDFDNGLRLITIPNDYPDIVALHIVVATGSRNEIEPGKSGFAHFFEHMMFRGSKNYSSAEQARIFKDVGADRNAYTTDDYTNYHTTFAKEDLATVLEIEADRFQHLQYAKKVFRTESQAVFGEYNKNSSNPISKMFEVLRDTAFQEHPYQHTTMGFLRDIVKMPRQYDYSKSFFERWYKPEYVTIVAVGAVNHLETLQLVKKHFGGWKRGTHTAEIPVEPPQSKPLTCHVPWRTPTQPWIGVAFHGPAFSPDSRDMPTLDVLSSVAFSPSSEIYKKLFVTERKVDAFFAHFPDHKDPYLLMVFARVKKAEDLAYVRDQILSTCESLKTQSVSASRLAEVKANLKYSFASGLDSSSAIAENLAHYIAQSRTPAVINKLYAMYDAVNARDVQGVARRYFVPNAKTTITLLQGEAPELGEVHLSDVAIESRGDDDNPAAPALATKLELDPEAGDPSPALLIPNRSPLISFRIVFPTGAAADPRGKEGLANITSQMITNAATAKRSYEDVVAAEFPMAAGIAASVDKQMTVFVGTVHRDNLATYYNLLKEMLTTPGFQQADLDRIKSNTVSAIDAGLRRADDEETGKEVLYEEIYRGHAFGHMNMGTIEGVRSVTLDDVKTFYTEQLRGAFLGMSGSYPRGFPAKVAADLEAAFGKPRDVAADKRDFRKGIAKIQKNRLTIVEKDTRATGIHLGFPIDINRSHPDWVALWLVRSYFGEHRSENSLLYQRLREIRGLNYGDYAYIEYFPGGGGRSHPAPNLARSSQIFQIWIRPVPEENGPFTFRAMNYELRKLVNNGMSKKHFEATRTYLSKFVNILVASQDRQLGYAIDSRFYGIGPFADHVKNELRKLTVDDVNRVIKKYLRTDRLQFVVITRDAKAFRAMVMGDAPTPISYLSKPAKYILDEDKVIERLKVPIDTDAVKIVPIGEVFVRR
jgi:zinc protease